MWTLLRNDIRLSLRILLRNPAFACAAIVILALGIGANATVFSFVDSVLLEPLGYPDASRLVQVWEYNSHTHERSWVYYGNFLDWKERARTFDDLALYNVWEANVWGDPEPERVKTGWVSGNYFHLLGAQALLGRTLAYDDEKLGSHKVAVISHSLWQRRFGGAPEALGASLRMPEGLYEVVGVLPPDFLHPGAPELEQPELFLPYLDEPDYYDYRSGFTWDRAIGRLAPGVELSAAQLDLDRVARELEAEHPETNSGRGVMIQSLQHFVVGDLRAELRFLFLAVGLVLLVICANLSSLMTVRSAGRRREMAVRLALGAPRARLVCQLTVESLVLALFGAALGIVLALGAVAVIRASGLPGVPRLAELSLDGTTAVFTLVIAFAGAMFFGLLPAVRSSRQDLHLFLKDGARSVLGRGDGWQRLLVAAEVALALVLVVGSGLLIRSYQRILDSSPGFRPEQVLVVDLTVDGERYDQDNRAQVVKVWEELTASLRAQPGVEAVGGVSMPPLLTHDDAPTLYLTEGRELPPAGQEPIAQAVVITPGYIDAMGLHLIEGRDFENRDRRDAEAVVVVNRTLAERSWPGESAVGQRLRFPDVGELDDAERTPWMTVVGVVGDVRLYNFDTDPVPEIYRPHAQMPWKAMNLVVRSNLEPAALVPLIRREARKLDPNQPLRRITTMGAAYDRSLARRRLLLGVLSVFAAVALVVAAVGIYGVMAWSVSQRTREIGLRMALGARAENILAMVLAQSGRLFALGLVLGLPLTWLLTRAMSGMIFGASGFDAVTFLVASTVLGVAVFVASFVPAWRASRVDPLEALHYE